MMADDQAVRVRIEVIDLPGTQFGTHRGVELGIQAGDETLPPDKVMARSATFSCELRVRPNTDPPVFLGSFAFGTPRDRFLYLVWSAERNGVRTMFRRIKIPLKSVTRSQIDEAIQTGRALVARLNGMGRDGSPACATVPLLGGGWSVE